MDKKYILNWKGHLKMLLLPFLIYGINSLGYSSLLSSIILGLIIWIIIILLLIDEDDTTDENEEE